MLADLHCHSTFSDGSATPAELVLLAKRLGLDALSVTDHDTLRGSDTAAEYCQKNGIDIKIITGTEISCYDYERRRNVHLLCYLPKKRERLDAFLAEISRRRTEAVEKSFELIAQRYPISLEAVTRRRGESAALFKQHIMLALMDAGYTHEVFGSEFRRLFKRKSGEGSGWARVTFEHPDIFSALELVIDSGGIPVLAHPAVYDSYDIIPELVEHGLRGIEVYYPRAEQGDAERLGDICRRHGLIMTGGTDFHGANSPKPLPLGTCTASSSEIEKLLGL